MDTESKKVKWTDSRWFKICTAALIVLLIAAVVFLLLRPVPDETARSGGLVLDENAEDIQSEIGGAAAEQQGIKIPGYESVVFPSGETDVQLTLMNPAGNECNFVYELYIDEDDTPVYTSGLIEPGKEISEITLANGLESGEYTLYMKVKAFSQETDIPLNGALVTVPLTVY